MCQPQCKIHPLHTSIPTAMDPKKYQGVAMLAFDVKLASPPKSQFLPKGQGNKGGGMVAIQRGRPKPHGSKPWAIKPRQTTDPCFLTDPFGLDSKGVCHNHSIYGKDTFQCVNEGCKMAQVLAHRHQGQGNTQRGHR